MQRIVVIVFMISGWMMACTGPDKTAPAAGSHLADTANYTTIQWLDSLVDFGTITQGEKIQIKFRFKNTGNKPLFITNVRAGCGCTVPSYTKEAVAPGAEGEVMASFDTNRSLAGDTRKTVVVHTNTRNGSEHSLIFTGHVKEVKVN
jgi:hypothetical protein